MRIKLDENLPLALVPVLEDQGHDVDTVETERLIGRSDEEVWRAAQEEGRFLITQDLDFSDVRKYEPGSHMGLLLIRLSQPGRLALTKRVLALFASEAIEQWHSCLVVATEHKVRVRRPK